MPGITEKTVSSNNWNMAFKALDELTVGREQNRGTIEVVKRDDLGGMVEGDAGAVTLKCSHHHWYSRGLDTVSQSQAIDLNTFVEKTVVDAVNDICDELLKNNPLQKEGINDKRDKLLEQFRAEIGRFTQHGENAISPLSREQIKTIVLQVKNIKSMTAEQLLNSGIDSVEDIKNWAKGELGKLPSQANVRTKLSTLLKAFVARPDVAQAAVLEKARHGGVDLLDSFLASALDTIKQSKSDVSVGGNLGKLLNASNLDASFPGITERIDSILKSVDDINLNLTDVENDVNFNKNWEHRAVGKNVQQGKVQGNAPGVKDVEEKNINVDQPQNVNAPKKLERTYSDINYLADIDSILDDPELKDDAPVYFTDKTRTKLGCGNTEQWNKMSPREQKAGAGSMRAGLLKYAYEKLGVKLGQENAEGVSEKDRYVLQKLKTTLLGGKGEEGAKVASSPVTKGDLEYVKWMLGGARIDGNPAVSQAGRKGVPKVSQLTVEQQMFLDNEAKEFKTWYDAKKEEWAKSDIDLDKSADVRKSEVLSWKLQKAFDKDYQEKVCRLFGKLLEPRQSKGQPEAKNPSVQTTVETLGGDGKSARHHANVEHPSDVFCYQIAADATYCGGTLLEGGQEEALFMDMPAMNLAYLLHEGYVEPYDKLHDTPLQIDHYDGKQRLWLKYSLDENGMRKMDTWMGACLPTYSSTTDGIPNENGETKMSWFSFCAATALGGAGGATGNIDRGGFLRALENRPVKPLNRNDPEQVKNANAFFDEIENTCKAFKKRTAPKDVQFLNNKEKFGYGASYDKKVWNEMMFLAHFYTSGDFDVLASNAKEQFKKLLDLMRGGEYKEAIDEAFEVYVEITEKQHVGWVANQNETGADRVAHTNPGGTLFANSRPVTLKAEGKAIQGWGGEQIHSHFGFSDTSQTTSVNNAFQDAKKVEKSKGGV